MAQAMVTKALLPVVVLVRALVAADICNVEDEGTSFNPAADEKSACDVFVLDEQFSSMLTTDVKLALRHESSDPIFHEGPVLFDDEDALYFTTNRLGPDGAVSGTPTWLETAPTQLNQFINIMKFDLNTNELITLDTSILMANGMTKTADGNNLLVISQGYNTTGGGIYELNRQTLEVEPVVTSYYGLDLNSPNDVEVTEDEIMFFDDPVYSFEQGFKVKNPVLGSNVYRYDIPTKTQTLLSTALQRPNGVALFDDRENGNGCTLYVSDSGYEPVPIGGSSVQTPRGFFGGDGALYSMKDDGDGCFAAKDGPWDLQPLVPAVKGIIDGMEVHRSAELLLYCDGTGLWIWSISQHKNIGLVSQRCVQVIFSQELGLNDVFILTDDNLYEIQLNFKKPERSSEKPEKSSRKSSKSSKTNASSDYLRSNKRVAKKQERD